MSSGVIEDARPGAPGVNGRKGERGSSQPGGPGRPGEKGFKGDTGENDHVHGPINMAINITRLFVFSISCIKGK